MVPVSVIVGVLLLTNVALVAASSAGSSSKSKPGPCNLPPVWPKSYEVEYTYTSATTTSFLLKPLQVSVHAWIDNANNRTRVDLNKGTFQAVEDFQQERFWIMYPKVNTLTCEISDVYNPYDDALSTGFNPLLDSWDLPNLAAWSFAGTTKVRGTKANIWQISTLLYNGTAGEPLVFQFFTAATSAGRPLQLTVLFPPDTYTFEFTRWVPGPIDDSVFWVPPACAGQLEDRAIDTDKFNLGSAYSIFGSLVPPIPGMQRVGAANVPWQIGNGLTAGNQAGGSSAGCSNNGRSSCTVGVNSRTHLTPAQRNAFRKGLAPHTAADLYGSGSASNFSRSVPNEQLPAYVDYRGTGFDGPGAKDQALCNSCWAFSAIGALQGAWYKATGQTLSLSEQQLMDCAWNFIPGAGSCTKGVPYFGVQYVIAAGGIALEYDYPYTGTFDYCRSANLNTTAPTRAGVPLYAKFKEAVLIPPNDPWALKEALVTYGPLAVEIAIDPLYEYAGGVYNNEATCGSNVTVDHAVLLVGYGTTEYGEDYWIIKNSWGTAWGIHGYALISTANDCGITQVPAVAAVADEAAAALAVAAHQAQAGAAPSAGAGGGGSRRLLQ